MRIYNIRENDIANGEGVRLSLFTQGCMRHCPNCFNKETWDVKGGREFTKYDKEYILKELSKDKYSGLSILGGEPLYWYIDICALCKSIKLLLPNKDIWLWTGYSFEEVCKMPVSSYLLENIDVIVDGDFQQDKKVYNQFRGSSNQRIIHLKEGKVFKIE